MNVVMDILGAVCCVLIFVQDMRTRMISLVLFLLAGISFGIEFVFYTSENAFLLVANYLFVSVQVAFLYFYFTRVKKTSLDFFDSIMGWGDVLMLLCMGMVFPLPQFVFYLMFSYLLGLGFALFKKMRGTEVTIPLAGIMALVHVLNLCIYYCTQVYLIQPFSA